MKSLEIITGDKKNRKKALTQSKVGTKAEPSTYVRVLYGQQEPYIKLVRALHHANKTVSTVKARCSHPQSILERKAPTRGRTYEKPFRTNHRTIFCSAANASASLRTSSVCISRAPRNYWYRTRNTQDKLLIAHKNNPLGRISKQILSTTGRLRIQNAY